MLTLTTDERRRGERALEIHFSAEADLPSFSAAARILFEETADLLLVGAPSLISPPIVNAGGKCPIRGG